MAETTDRNRAFTEGDDPATYNAGPVQEFLATASKEETSRILAAEQTGEDRTGVQSAAEARLKELDMADQLDGPQELQEDQAPAPDPTEASAKDTTGAEGDVNTQKDSYALADSVGSSTVHQEGAPAAMVEAVEESERLGYVAPEQNALKPSKPDYSQANPAVMNRE